MSDIPQVAIDRAIEAGQARKERELDDYGRSTVAGVVDAALPIIAEAAYREGLLKAREIVEALKFPKDWTEYAQGQNETVAAALAVVTGKEGASDER